MVGFERACALLETALAGDTRREIIERLAQSPQLGPNLLRLRDSMQSHVWKAEGRTIDLQRFVPAYDAATRKEGLHAMHDWDGVADHVNSDMIAVDVLNYIADLRGDNPSQPIVLAIVLDYYFMYILAL